MTPRAPIAVGLLVLTTFWVLSEGTHNQPGSTPTDSPAPVPCFVRVSESVFTGGEPKDNVAFQRLAALNFKTLVSVDGSIPNVDLAAKYGLDYIHIPIGYGALTEESLLSFHRVALEAQTPVLVHCHYGKHRGPVAAVLIALSRAELNIESALKQLRDIGTSTEYSELWKAVSSFKKPSPDAALPQLVPIAETSSLSKAMSELDRHFSALESIREAGWTSLRRSPDITPRSIVVLVREALVETARLHASGYPADFKHRLNAASKLARSLEQHLESDSIDTRDTLFGELKASCRACHRTYRE